MNKWKKVYKLSILYNPKIFVDAGIFIVNPELLPKGSSNKFYKITDETIGIHVNEQLVIGGRTVKVLNVMVCDSSWLKRNYIDPLEALINEIERRLCPGKSYPPIVNKETSIISQSKSVKFGNKPVFMDCKYCKSSITTTTKSEINCVACCSFLICNILYLICKALAHGDVCCCNVIHYCLKCGRMLGKYETC